LATLAASTADDWAGVPAAGAAAAPSGHPVDRDGAVAAWTLPEPVAATSPFYERGCYRASGGARPVALIASAGAILGIVAAMATLSVVAKHKERSRLTTIEVSELDVTPPPPPPEPTRLETQLAAPSPTVVPRPMIEVPSQGPVQVAVDAPPPAAPPPSAPSQGTAPAAAPAASPPAATTQDGGDLSSKVLFAKPPAYPTDARRAREQGTVKLLVLVGTDGRVSDIKVAASSGSQRLDRAALQAVRRWRWSPTLNGGIATAVRGYVTIPFVLVNAA
jgi:protein TonB